MAIVAYAEAEGGLVVWWRIADRQMRRSSALGLKETGELSVTDQPLSSEAAAQDATQSDTVCPIKNRLSQLKATSLRVTAGY